MTPALYWLTLTILMTALFWLPYILDRMLVRGLWPTLTGGPGDGEHSDWAFRAMNAHKNAVENLVIFAPLVLIAHVLGLNAPILGSAAALYFFARLAHFIVYVMNIPVARTLAFAAGWIAQIVFIAAILRWI